MEEINVLVIADHDNHTISVDTLKTIKAAHSLISAEHPNSMDVLVVGFDCESVVGSVMGIEGVSTVIVADAACYEQRLSDNVTTLVLDAIKNRAEGGGDYTHVLAPATTFGKDLMPRIAALLDVGQLSDVIEIETPDTVIRPIYAGNALARVKSNDRIKVMTIRSSSFDAVTISGEVLALHLPNK
jgi:electron transfer flavoprotein alpha subunit